MLGGKLGSRKGQASKVSVLLPPVLFQSLHQPESYQKLVDVKQRVTKAPGTRCGGKENSNLALQEKPLFLSPSSPVKQMRTTQAMPLASTCRKDTAEHRCIPWSFLGKASRPSSKEDVQFDQSNEAPMRFFPLYLNPL